MTRVVSAVVFTVLVSACSSPSDPPPPSRNSTPAAPALAEIPPASEQQISPLEKANKPFIGDLDAIIERGYLRILVAPSRAHFETAEGRHHGRSVDAGVALASALSGSGKAVQPVFIDTPEDRLIADLLAGKGDIAANLLLTFARDDQVAFA